MAKMEGVAWLHGAAPEMESRGRGMEIDTDSGLARSALTMWRRRTLHPDHIHTGEQERGGDMYADCSCCSDAALRTSAGVKKHSEGEANSYFTVRLQA